MDRLAMLGYLKQSDSGDDVLAEALKAFQKLNDLPVTGELDWDTYDLLMNLEMPIEPAEDTAPAAGTEAPQSADTSDIANDLDGQPAVCATVNVFFQQIQ